MTQHLALRIHLHDERFHGVGDWPPAPARVFQALVAGSAVGATLPPDALEAFQWLERLPPPIIACPRGRAGQRVETYVPNNDADALRGDLGRIGEIKAKKAIVPQLIEGSAPFVYVWPLAESGPATRVVEAADRLYQFGRGVDMAWAVAEICEDDAVTRLLAEYEGTVHRPTVGEGKNLACPTIGSVASLVTRHGATAQRLRMEGEGKSVRTLFAQPPKPRFAEVTYDAASERFLYELASVHAERKLLPWPLRKMVRLVEQLRDGAAERLRAALPHRLADIECALIGRKPDGSGAGVSPSTLGANSTSDRVRILPLPSIGHENADHAVRRVLVEVPSSAALPAGDVQWAFSGLAPVDPETGEVEVVVTPTADDRMSMHFTGGGLIWRTITPAALPQSAGRRRIDPKQRQDQAKSADERLSEERRAISAVHTALRHARVDERAVEIRVQREPFHTKGTRAESFATSRFAKERLWHVHIEFARAVRGPLAIGDGRFLGLGLLAPDARDHGRIFAFHIENGLLGPMNPEVAARALRRAVMARTQAVLGRRPLPSFFTGHEEDGKPMRSERSTHLAFQALGDQLLILPPHLLDRRSPSREDLRNIELLDQAVAELGHLNAGPLGRLVLSPCSVSRANSPLFAQSATWRSATPYRVNRHAKAGDAATALANDLIATCVDSGLPRPEVQVDRVRAIAGRGLEGDLRIRFPVAVAGPLLLGRSRYLGGGLFSADSLVIG